MLNIDIPGWKKLSLEYAVFDLNGTLSQAGVVEAETRRRVELLALHLSLFVLTADTRGSAGGLVRDVPISLHVIASGRETAEKQAFIQSLGADRTAYAGNGANDASALQTACLGICIVGKEGCWGKSAMAADIIVPSIEDALDLFLYPERMVATLRR